MKVYVMVMRKKDTDPKLALPVAYTVRSTPNEALNALSAATGLNGNALAKQGYAVAEYDAEPAKPKAPAKPDGTDKPAADQKPPEK